MNSLRSLGRIALPAVLGFAGIQPVKAEAPVDRPFSMRGVELGITIEEFRQAAIPNDDARFGNPQVWCSSDKTPYGVNPEIRSEDKAEGLVNCQWFSAHTSIGFKALTQHWVPIGTGGGWPVFHFIEQDGQLRLFQISFYANGQYFDDILDALRRGYGPPVATVEPFKTKAGGDFTSETDVWDNGLSTITLVERCGHLERYCLTYEHKALVKTYNEMLDRRAAAAAWKI